MPPDLVGDMGLKTVLEGFAAAILSAPSPREAVRVTMARHDGFQNVAVTPAGNRLLLDEPVHFGGRGEAPDPAEALLAAVGASLSVTLTAHAVLQGLRIDRISAALSADIDGRSFFHPGTGEAGMLDMKIELTVASPDKKAAIEALLESVLLATPVLATLKRPPAVTLIYAESRQP